MSTWRKKFLSDLKVYCYTYIAFCYYNELYLNTGHIHKSVCILAHVLLFLSHTHTNIELISHTHLFDLFICIFTTIDPTSFYYIFVIFQRWVEAHLVNCQLAWWWLVFFFLSFVHCCLGYCWSNSNRLCKLLV